MENVHRRNCIYTTHDSVGRKSQNNTALSIEALI